MGYILLYIYNSLFFQVVAYYVAMFFNLHPISQAIKKNAEGHERKLRKSKQVEGEGKGWRWVFTAKGHMTDATHRW